MRAPQRSALAAWPAPASPASTRRSGPPTPSRSLPDGFALQARREDLHRAGCELRAAAAGLRAKADEIRAAVAEARARTEESGEQLLGLAAEADREISRGGPETAERAVLALERRLEELRLEEGERHRAAELQRLRSELELESLSARAAEAERGEAEAALAAAGPLPALRAQVAAEEREIQELEARATAREQEVACAASEQEWQCREWCRMMAEDQLEQVSLAIMEQECDRWEQRLHAIVAPAAFGQGSNPDRGEGLHRLDAELNELGGRRRAPRAPCAECLGKLAEKGPWRLVYGEIQEAYALADKLRASNDELAGEAVKLRWHRLGRTMPPVVDAAPPRANAAPAAMVVTQPHLPPGPRFTAPAIAAAKGRARSSSCVNGRRDDDERPATAMPRAVTTDRADWEAGRREAPKQPQDRGLAFLCKATKQRFRPSTALPANAGFDSIWAGQEAQKELRPPATAPGPAELARLTAAAFKEPLSSSLGTSRAPSSAPALPGRGTAEASRPRQRAEWVTFSSGEPAASMLAAPAAPATPSRPGSAPTPPSRSFPAVEASPVDKGFPAFDPSPAVATAWGFDGVGSTGWGADGAAQKFPADGGAFQNGGGAFPGGFPGGGEWPAAGSIWSPSPPGSLGSDTETGTASSTWGRIGNTKPMRTTALSFADTGGWVEDLEFHTTASAFGQAPAQLQRLETVRPEPTGGAWLGAGSGFGR